ncbi:MAG: dipeptide ABC transporter ATP-binding protein [Betaproteobacteria bacterium]|nr:dipeptide ABC transporter ATP-binding protein [Betaproteobacteria bacterium]
MSAPLISISELRTWLASGEGVVRAVDGLSLALERGETFALLGESGCGKSMTALSVMRLLPDAGRIVTGEVRIDGLDLLALPEAEMRGIRGRRVAMIFQEPMLSLNPVLTVGEQVGEALRRHTTLRGAAVAGRVRELLDAVGIPDAARRVREYPFHLSGGMKQRVMIAMALACNPELLVADEPTTALDVTIQAQVLDLLRELQRQTGMTLLLITHDLGVVSEMAHRVAVMYAGEIVEVAPRAQFFSHPAHPYSRKLFDSLPGRHHREGALAVIRGSVPPLTSEFRGCRFAERCDSAWALCRETAPAWHEVGEGRGVRCHLFAPGEKREASVARREERKPRPPPAAATESGARPAPGSSLLTVEGLKVHFPVRKGVLKRVAGYVRAVDGVSLAIGRGRTLGLVGESGCGKTTVGKGILRLIEPTAGTVLFAGEDLSRMPRRELRPRRKHVQIIFQDPFASLNPRMRVSEIIEEGMVALGIGADAFERARRIDALLNEVGLAPEVKHRYPHEFSGGQRQRIAIARALAVEPQLIVCDEPTSSLDISVQAQILNLLRDLQRKKGLAYLFITHNISVVEFLAHEVAVMYLGRIVEHGTVDEVLGNPQHPYTRALLSAVPMIDPAARREVMRLPGDLPSPLSPPAGCHFHPRCPAAMPRCREAYPESNAVSATRTVCCHLYSGG